MKRPSMPGGQPGQPDQPVQSSAASRRPAKKSSDHTGAGNDWFQAISARLSSGQASASRVESAAEPQVSPVQQKAQQFAARLSEERRRSAWLSGFRFSAFSLILAGVLIIGVLSLIPRVQELVAQRQQINALKADIAATQTDTAAKLVERQQWNDPTYVETQAREQLYFAKPGDVTYLVINDLSPAQLASTTGQQATDSVQQTQSNWLGNLLGSAWVAGNATINATTTSTTPTPTETPAQ